MAILAWIFEKNAVPAASSPRSGAPRNSFALRPLPNEEIHVFTKRIDNSRVVREQDPQATGAAVKTIMSACLAAVGMVGLLVPAANTYLAGYTLTELDKQNSVLEAELARLEVREANLTSLEALARAAKNQKFVDPTPESMVVLNDDRTGDVAMNRKNKQ
ncbi:MAG: hypothetical protein FJW30_18660 [Acidobacteria bacterium]|nr:hypothetical protein [Acidobacteriota bacterium]